MGQCWSVGVEWSQILEWQMLGIVLLPGITEHCTIGKIDCSFDPGGVRKIHDTTQPFLMHGH